MKNYAPRAATLDQDGLAFLAIRRGEVYAVKVNNDSQSDAAVTLTIDGLSMYSFSDNKNYEVVFVHAGKSGIIPGWHRTNDVSDSFQVAEYAKSAVAKLLPSSSTFGTITVSFKAAWPKDSQPPADEPDPKRNTRSADATAGQPDRREIRRGNTQHRPVPRVGERPLQQGRRPSRLAQAESLM